MPCDWLSASSQVYAARAFHEVFARRLHQRFGEPAPVQVRVRERATLPCQVLLSPSWGQLEPRELAEWLKDAAAHETVAVVGHEPNLAELTALADPDAHQNYEVMLRLRDLLVGHGTVEEWAAGRAIRRGQKIASVAACCSASGHLGARALASAASPA